MLLFALGILADTLLTLLFLIKALYLDADAPTERA